MEDVKLLIRSIIKAGGLSILLLVFISTSIYFIMFMIVMDLDPSEIVIQFILLIVPVIFMLFIGGLLTVPIIFMQEEKISNARAGFQGAAVGAVIVSIYGYIISRLFLANIYPSFFEIISSGITIDFYGLIFVLIFYKYPFIIPCIIDVLAIAYFGCRTNNLKNQQTTLFADE